MARWCDGGQTQRSRLGSQTDKAVKTAKRRAAEAHHNKVAIDNDTLENVPHFEYMGSRLQCDGNNEADVRHRMKIAQSAFGSLRHLWADRPPPLTRYQADVVSALRVLGPNTLLRVLDPQ